MPSTFFGLSIGTSGLYTYQAALNTTAHNISNAQTTGYSRQVLTQKAGTPIKVNSSYGMAGTGVDVAGVTQERNTYYDMKYWKNNSIYGEYNTKSSYLSEVETYFNEVQLEGFTTSFNYFNNSLQSLSTDPSSTTVRTQVVSYGQSLAEYFNSLYNNMQSIQGECNTEVKTQVNQVNSLAKQIATLNQQINTMESGGGTANDLRDQRALLIDQLSQIANVTVTENQVGAVEGVNSYVVKIDGNTLVDTGNYNTLKVVPRDEKVNQNDIDGLYDIVWSNTGQTFNTGSDTLTGSLKALIEMRDGNNGENLRGTISSASAGSKSVTLTNSSINNISELNIPASGTITIGNQDYTYSSYTATASTDASGNTTYSYTFTLDEGLKSAVSNASAEIGDSISYKGLPYYMSELNEFVRTYAKAFNDIQKQAKDLNGDTGLDFFTGGNAVSSFSSDGDYSLLTAGNFTVSSTIYKNPKLLAISADTTAGVSDSTYLNKMIALASDKSLFAEGTPASFLNAIVGDVGIDSSSASNLSDSQSNILTLIENQRLSVSGVDTEEEAIDLLRYQNAYNLCSKAISVMNEVYDKLINETGV